MIGDMCRNFADTELKPIAGILDKEHRYPKEQVEKLGELGKKFSYLFGIYCINNNHDLIGMMGVSIDQEWGGSGMDTTSYAIALAEISRGCASTGVIMSVNNSLYSGPVDKYGSAEQKEQFLRPCASGIHSRQLTTQPPIFIIILPFRFVLYFRPEAGLFYAQ